MHLPSPGVVNNSSGTNGYEGIGGQENNYGAVKRLEQSLRASPIAPYPGKTAPKQAQRASQRPQAAPVQAQQAPPEDPAAWHARSWGAIASDPEASELVREYAAQYTGQWT